MTQFPELKHGEMKINVFFKKNTDVGAIADTLVEDIAPNSPFPVSIPFTAFNHATEHKAANGNELHVARNEDINVFTDYKTFITVDPLSDKGEDIAAYFISVLSNGEDMTHLDAHPLVVKL